MTFLNRLLLSAPLALMLASCGNPDSMEAGAASDSAYVGAEAGPTMDAPQRAATYAGRSSNAASEATSLQNRMVIRTADLRIRVEDIESSEREVQKIVRTAGGYISQTNSNDLSGTRPSLSVSMRVPVERFDAALAELEALGTRLTKTVGSQDVTEQVVDLDARLKTLSANEETLRGILTQTRQLDEVIKLNDKLTEVRATIESLTGQRKSLASAASLSNISLTMERNAVPHAQPSDPNWMAQSWGEATTSFSGTLRTLSTTFIWLAVFSPFWLPIAYFGLRGFRRTQKRKQPVLRPEDLLE
jgi:hypothetical protein